MLMSTPAHIPVAAAEVDYFALLDLPRRFTLDLADLERRYLERTRAVHPDRMVGRGADERARGTGAAIDLNRAYKVLKRPASRAEHLLALAGVRIGDNETVPAALLHEILELREELDAARERGDRAELGRIEALMRARERSELDQLTAALATAEGATGTARAAVLAEAKGACLALRYVARTLEALEDDDDDEETGALRR
jgi:molecular chaperone HscB